MAWNSAWSVNVRLMSPLQCLEDIYGCLAQKIEAANFSDASMPDLNTPPKPLYFINYYVVAAGEPSAYNYILDIKSYINELIPLFANHTTQIGGTWEGLTSIPAWTKADILTEIGESEVDADELEDLYPWFTQVYKILNLLRIIRFTATIDNRQEKAAQSYINWTDCQSELYAESYYYSSGSNIGYSANQTTPGRWQAGILQTNDTFEMGGGSLEHSDSFYIYAGKGGADDFEDFDGVLTENEFSILEDWTESGAISRNPLFPPEASLYNRSAPASGKSRACLASPDFPDRIIFVCDYSGENGFTYQDWLA